MTTASQSVIGSRYRLHQKLGQGGIGAVYRAHDRLTGLDVALKQLHMNSLSLQAVRSATQTDDPLLAIANEFQVMASLRHPHIVSVYDYGFDTRGQPYFTMTLLDDAVSITDAANDLPFDAQIGLLVQVLQALAYIHRRGLLHRDLKPSNVLVKNNHVYVVDFGLAQEHGTKPEYAPVAGTIAYMAPELFHDAPASQSADLYALGIIAYEIFAGKHPFADQSITEMIMSIVQREIDLTPLAIPPQIKAVIARLLARDPSQRYSIAENALRDLTTAAGLPPALESIEIRESYLQAARFVGRKHELGLLQDALSATTTGKGSGWLIGGESGVGKSRLVNELRALALVKGALVLGGQAVSDGGLAYQVWREIARRLILIGRLTDSQASALAQLVPDIESLIEKPVPPLDHADPEQAQRALYAAMESLLRQALTSQPVVLVLEDLQWAVDSLAMLRELLPLIHELPLIIVGTYRDDESPNLPDKLPDMTPIPLRRLTVREIEHLSASMLGEVGRIPVIVNLLQRETEGNVFFVVEVVRALAEEVGSLDEIGKATLPTHVMSGGIKRIVQYRLNRVPDWALPWLDVAAVMGRRIDEAVMQTAASSLNLELWLRVCADAAVLEVSENAYRFAHDKLREGVLAALEPERKVTVNRMVAEAIEQVYADSVSSYALMLAQHWAAAGNEPKEAYYSTLAAHELRELDDHTSARQLYERALALNGHQYFDNPAQALADLYHGIGRACYGISDYQGVIHWQTKALEHYRQIGDRFGEADSIYSLGEIDLRQSYYDLATEKIAESLVIFRELGETKKAAYSLMSLGIIKMHRKEIDDAIAIIEECLELMRATGDQRAVGRALNNLALAYDVKGNAEHALEIHEEALALRYAINDRGGIVYSLANMGLVAKDLGQNEVALARLQEAYERSLPLGERRTTATILSTIGDLYQDMKRYHESERAQREALHIRFQIDDRHGIGHSLGALVILLCAMQRTAEARAMLTELVAHAQIDSNMYALWGNSTVYAAALLAKTEGQDARAVMLYSALVRHKQEMAEELKDTREALEELSRRMPPEAFAAAQQQGETMGFDAAFEEAARAL